MRSFSTYKKQKLEHSISWAFKSGKKMVKKWTKVEFKLKIDNNS